MIWTEDFNEDFRKQKGYDVFETLPGMFRDIGPVTPKASLDFMDVKVRLSEERYFKPIFEWHWKRGKIYGCDPEGRGKNPGNTATISVQYAGILPRGMILPQEKLT